MRGDKTTCMKLLSVHSSRARLTTSPWAENLHSFEQKNAAASYRGAPTRANCVRHYIKCTISIFHSQNIITSRPLKGELKKPIPTMHLLGELRLLIKFCFCSSDLRNIFLGTVPLALNKCVKFSNYQFSLLRSMTDHWLFRSPSVHSYRDSSASTYLTS